MLLQDPQELSISEMINGLEKVTECKPTILITLNNNKEILTSLKWNTKSNLLWKSILNWINAYLCSKTRKGTG